MTTTPRLTSPRVLPASVLNKLPPTLRTQQLAPLHPAHSVLVAPHMHEHMERLPQQGKRTSPPAEGGCVPCCAPVIVGIHVRPNGGAGAAGNGDT